MLWSGVAGVRRFQLREKRKCRGSRLRHNTGDLTSAQLQEAGTEKKKGHRITQADINHKKTCSPLKTQNVPPVFVTGSAPTSRGLFCLTDFAVSCPS